MWFVTGSNVRHPKSWQPVRLTPLWLVGVADTGYVLGYLVRYLFFVINKSDIKKINFRLKQDELRRWPVEKPALDLSEKKKAGRMRTDIKKVSWARSLSISRLYAKMKTNYTEKNNDENHISDCDISSGVGLNLFWSCGIQLCSVLKDFPVCAIYASEWVGVWNAERFQVIAARSPCENQIHTRHSLQTWDELYNGSHQRYNSGYVGVIKTGLCTTGSKMHDAKGICMVWFRRHTLDLASDARVINLLCRGILVMITA